MPRTTLKPIRMPELFANNAQGNSEQPQTVKRKFVPQRLTIADFQEFSPASKLRKVQGSSKANSEKKRFTAVRMRLTPADLQDTPLTKPKKKPGKGTMKTARKELFNTDRKSSKSNFYLSTRRKKLDSKNQEQSKKLDITNPLIDINEAEPVILKDAHAGFKKPLQLAAKQKSYPRRCSLEVLSKEHELLSATIASKKSSTSPKPTTSVRSTLEPILVQPFLIDEARTLSPSLNNVNSPFNASITDSAFRKMEREVGITNSTIKKTGSRTPLGKSPRVQTILKFHTPNKRNSSDLYKEIEDILQDQENDFRELREKFENFQEKYSRNQRRISNILKDAGKPSLGTNSTAESQNVSMLMPHLENLRVSTLKKVTFNLDSRPSRVSTRSKTSSKSNSAESSLESSINDTFNNIPAEDKSWTKAINMYNSFRNNYSTILATPKLNRAYLQSPASIRSSRRTTSISKRLQKQCLLLADTPMK